MDTHDELAAKLEDVATRLGVPGAVVGIWVGDRSYAAACGVANADYPTPITPATRFQVGSVTKTFTAAAVMQLVEGGSASLDDPVGRYLPGLAATGLDTEAITLEVALSHRAGFDGDHLFVAANATDLTALREARRFFEPGHGVSYNNAGFSIAGAVIEVVTGQPFADVVRRRLLKPLAMRGAGFYADDVITHPVAAPHVVFDGIPYVIRRAGWQPGWELAPIDHAAGGLIANVEHLLSWARFQTTGSAVDGELLLTRESLDRLHTAVVELDIEESIALDWFVRDIDGTRSIGHGGVTAGYNTELLVLPDAEVAFVGLTNSTNGSWLNDEMRRWALRHFAGLRDDPLVPDSQLVIDPDPFHGQFVHSFGVLTVTDGDEPGRLVITPSARDDVDGWQPPVDPPRTFGFVRHDHAVSCDPGPQQVVRFGGDAPGAVDWILWGGRRAVRVG